MELKVGTREEAGRAKGMDRHGSVTHNAETLVLTAQWDNYGDNG